MGKFKGLNDALHLLLGSVSSHSWAWPWEQAGEARPQEPEETERGWGRRGGFLLAGDCALPCLALQTVLFSDGKGGRGKKLASALPPPPNFGACLQLGPQLVGAQQMSLP